MHAVDPLRPDGPWGVHADEWAVAVRDLQDATRYDRYRTAIDLASRQGLTLRRDQARACGFDDATVRRLVRREIWSVPRRGVLCPLAPVPQLTNVHPRALATSPHGLADQVRAAAAALVRPGTVISHDSGATLHGLPLLHPIDRPTLCVVDDNHRVATPGATIRCGGMHPEEITDWFGAPALTAERVVADISRASGVAAGLVAADAALHLGVTTGALLHRTRLWSRYRPGIQSFDRVLDLADGGAESPLESLVRLCLVEAGLPKPELQAWIDTPRGHFRVDMLYRAQRVIIEADGELKYTKEAPLALVEEKRRQEALERLGYVVIRVGWQELHAEPWLFIARVRRALAAAIR